LPNFDPPLKRAVEALGGLSKMARALGVSPSAASTWKRAPPRHLPRLEQLTGIPGQVLRPDLYEPIEPVPVRSAGRPIE
jgi:DNA-binding transcriptional regulator YdaS (Cro superfamily)